MVVLDFVVGLGPALRHPQGGLSGRRQSRPTKVDGPTLLVVGLIAGIAMKLWFLWK